DFQDNHGPATGQDVAGGAIYGFGGGDTIIAGSTFTANSASDGGAVGSLNGDLTVINSTFTGNAATGTGGNPGNGGAGGAIYMDGGAEATSLCGVTIRDNSAGAIGGGLYLQGLALTITASTISRNHAFFNGGIWINTCQVQMTNTTIAENVAT